MVLEVVEIRIRAEDSAKFEMAITEALTTITARAQGMVKYRLIRGLETPSRYLMEIVWNGLEGPGRSLSIPGK